MWESGREGKEKAKKRLRKSNGRERIKRESIKLCAYIDIIYIYIWNINDIYIYT